MIHLFLFFLFIILPVEFYILSETKVSKRTGDSVPSPLQDLQTVCRGPQGITCSCRLSLLPLETQDVLITVSILFQTFQKIKDVLVFPARWLVGLVLLVRVFKWPAEETTRLYSSHPHRPEFLV